MDYSTGGSPFVMGMGSLSILQDTLLALKTERVDDCLKITHLCLNPATRGVVLASMIISWDLNLVNNVLSIHIL